MNSTFQTQSYITTNNTINNNPSKRYEKLYELSKLKKDALEFLRSKNLSKEDKEMMECTF